MQSTYEFTEIENADFESFELGDQKPVEQEQDFDSDEEQIGRDQQKLQLDLFLAVQFFVKDQPLWLISLTGG